MIKIIFILLLIVFYSSDSFASLTQSQFRYSLGINAPQYQQALSAANNIKKTTQFANYTPIGNVQSGWYVANGVEILTPVGFLTQTAELGASLVTVAGSPGSKVLARKALGILGPVATAVSIGMTLEDMFQEAQAHKTDYPLLYEATLEVSGNIPVPLNPSTLSGSFVSLPAFPDLSAETSGLPWTTDSSSSCLPENYFYPYAGMTITLPAQVQFAGPSTESCGSGMVYAKVYNVILVAHTPPPPRNATIPEFEDNISKEGFGSPSLDDLYPTMTPEYDKMLKNMISEASPNVAMDPSAQQIAELTKDPLVLAGVSADANQTALQSAQSAVDMSRSLSLANPADMALANTAAQLQSALDKLKADLALQEAKDAKAKADEEALTLPPVPSNTYDSEITPPEKKSIPDLLLSFVAGSPLVSMVKSFTMTTTGSCEVPIGVIYGQELSFDLCRWEPTLMACGGVLIIILQGFAILIVMRGW